MDAFVKEILTILTTPPGNLTYHIVLAFAVGGALQMALNQWSATRLPHFSRMVFGLGLLLLLRLALFLLAGLAWQGMLNEHLLLPPLDRGITLLSLVVAMWMWAFPQPLKLADAAMLLLGMLSITMFALGLVWWTGQDPATPYNASWPDQLADAAALALLILGAIFLAVRRPPAWFTGLAMFLLAALGHAAALVFPAAAGDYPGWVRLGQMAAFPLLLALPGRFALADRSAASPALNGFQAENPQNGKGNETDRRRLAGNPELLDEYLKLMSESDPARVCQTATRVAATTLLADIALLVAPPSSNGELIIQCGYDLIRQQALPGAALRSRQAPMLASATARGLSLHLPAGSPASDLKILAQIYELSHTGHLLLSPVVQPQGEPLFSLVLLTPYSNRPWNQDDQNLLNQLAGSLAQLLQRLSTTNQAETQLGQIQEAYASRQAQIDSLGNEMEQMRARLQAAQEELEHYRQRAESLAELVASHENPPQAASQPDSAQDSRRLLRSEAPDNSASEAELRLALEEVARLHSMLAEADQKFLAVASQNNGANRNSEMTEELSALVQELRQPMSAIIGYTDFLLGESVGILGVMQRKFLERVKMSTERMNRLVEDLARQTTPGLQGSRSGFSGTVDLYAVIDDAIAQVREQLQSCKVQLRLDLPENLPALNVDHEPLAQSLAHLLDNAACVTPAGQEISLSARLEGQEHQQQYVLIQVSDAGKGIPPEYLPRVFSRFTLGEGRPIPGIASNGANLPIVKALVENMGGRIWIDSRAQGGAIFSILLPLFEDLALDNLADGELPG